MTKVITRFCCVFTVLVLLFSVFVAGGHWPVFEDYLSHDDATIVVKQAGISSKLGFTEQQKISVADIQSVISDCAELTTVTDVLTREADSEDTRYFLEDIPIIGTTNTITLTCDAVVSVWYDLDDVTVRIDGDVIYISLPEPQVDSHIILDTVEVDEDNCIFNPIDYDQYRELYSSIEDDALNDAIADGIYDRAESNLQSVLRAFIGQITEYNIVFE